jgi:hypothetical protein
MRMVQRTHNLPSEHLKCDFGDFDEAIFLDVEKLYESI